MKPYSEDSGPFSDRVWSNAYGPGPMPRIAVQLAHEVVAWSQNPWIVPTERFHDAPFELKRTLARLINTRPEYIVLGNSASYGLHLWANGRPLKPGEEVLLVKGDFPATTLPWLALRKKGVIVREIKPEGQGPTSEDPERHINKATRVLCATWIDSFTGFAIDLAAIIKLPEPAYPPPPRPPPPLQPTYPKEAATQSEGRTRPEAEPGSTEPLNVKPESGGEQLKGEEDSARGLRPAARILRTKDPEEPGLGPHPQGETRSMDSIAVQDHQPQTPRGRERGKEGWVGRSVWGLGWSGFRVGPEGSHSRGHHHRA